MTTGDLYNVLGLPPKATAEEIRAAYHQAARRFHPDANPNSGASEAFRLVAHAYSILGDANLRTAYDTAIEQAANQPLISLRAIYSRQPLPALAEPQIVYVLIEVHPARVDALPSPPLNVCLVIDRSTSMQGARLEQVRSAVLQVIDGLRDHDTFAVVAFSDKAEVIVPAQPAHTDRTVAKAKVSTLNALGGTEILQGLLCGLTELHRNLSPAAVNHLLLLTDGRTYGDEADCLMLASLAATDGIVFSGLGIGDEWNDKFVDELTSRTGGTATYSRSPQTVAAFVQERVRGLGEIYAERLTAHVTLDPNVELLSVFRVAPESGNVPIEPTLRLGSLPRGHVCTLVMKFKLAPLTAGLTNIARIGLAATVVSLGRRDEQVYLDLQLPVVINAPPPAPPPALLDALGKLSQYQMQERAWQQAAMGDVQGAVESLKALGTRLLAAGQPDLARLALTEAVRIQRTKVWSEESKKQLRYGTRALIAPLPETARSA